MQTQTGACFALLVFSFVPFMSELCANHTQTGIWFRMNMNDMKFSTRWRILLPVSTMSQWIYRNHYNASAKAPRIPDSTK
jgi:hypothetical protein